jgi:hypothetical protein
MTSKGLVWMWTEKINHETEIDKKELDDNALLEVWIKPICIIGINSRYFLF